MNKSVSLVAGIAALAISTGAMAQPAVCVTEAEANALIGYSLPEVLQSVSNKCSPALPATSFLSSKGGQLVSTYRQGSAAHWPLAKAAFFKIGGKKAETDQVMASIPDSALQAIVTTAINVELVKNIKPADCARVDALVSNLAPLPLSNISALLVQLMAMAGPGKNNDFNLCPKS